MLTQNNTVYINGEKLNEEFVKTILDKFNIKENSNFHIFCPKKTEKEFFYTLYIDSKDNINFKELENEIEKELLANFHYKYARELGQLQHFKIMKIKNGMKQYLNFCTKNGQKLGNIKVKNFTSCTNYNFIGEFTV